MWSEISLVNGDYDWSPLFHAVDLSLLRSTLLVSLLSMTAQVVMKDYSILEEDAPSLSTNDNVQSRVASIALVNKHVPFRYAEEVFRFWEKPVLSLKRIYMSCLDKRSSNVTKEEKDNVTEFVENESGISQDVNNSEVKLATFMEITSCNMRDRACTILEAAIGNLDRSIEIYFSQQETEEKTKVLEISSDHEDEDLEMERIVTDNYDVILQDNNMLELECKVAEFVRAGVCNTGEMLVESCPNCNISRIIENISDKVFISISSSCQKEFCSQCWKEQHFPRLCVKKGKVEEDISVQQINVDQPKLGVWRPKRGSCNKHNKCRGKEGQGFDGRVSLMEPGRIHTNFTGFNMDCGVFTFGEGSSNVKKGQSVSQDPTMYGQEEHQGEKTGLRPIVIDGSNVAMTHGHDKVFSCRGIQMVVDFFIKRGHNKIAAFVPQFRQKAGQVKDKQILEKLEKAGHIVFTPSREVGNKRITSYDDTFILDYAAKYDGLVITRDNFRDLVN